MSKLWIFLLAGLLVPMGAAIAAGNIPEGINYQGLVVDQDTGEPLSGTVDLTFHIYAFGGVDYISVWDETHSGVPVADGVFDVILGQSRPFGGVFDVPGDLYLGVTVGTGAEMVPRTLLTSVPFAHRAAVADSARTSGNGGGDDGDWVITGSDMHAGVSGKVGIGDNNPQGKLEVREQWLSLTAGYMDNNTHYGAYASSGDVAAAYLAYTLRPNDPAQENYGVYGTTFTPSGTNYGVFGEDSQSGNYGYLGGEWNGVYGNGNNFGVVGVKRTGAGTGAGGVKGEEEETGNLGILGSETYAGFFSNPGAGITVSVAANGFPQNVGLKVTAIGETAAELWGDVVVKQGNFTTPTVEITGGSDLSESFDIRGLQADLRPDPGMLVSIDPDHPGSLVVSREAYDRKVAGVISGAGGIRPGMLMGQEGSVADGADPVALSGRVYCWADASPGAIAPGDLLTTSDVPGHAMKVSDHAKAQGAIVGKAMSSLDAGTGLVLVLVNLQ